jgi:NADH-quinone oxidoreductase subunit J
MELLIYFLEILGIVSSIMVIGFKNPVHSVFSLILTFCISSCLLLSINIDFLAMIFIVVYVGAIAVLFLFVVMMLNIKLVQFTESIIRYIPFGIILCIIFVNEIYFINFKFKLITNVQNDWINYFINSDAIVLIGEILYTNYIHLFVLAGLILLIAMVGTINITLYHASNVRRQNISTQLGRDVLQTISLKKN